MKVLAKQAHAYWCCLLITFMHFPAHAEEVLQLTAQGSYFTLVAQANIKYGASDSFNLRVLQPGTYYCGDSFFGNPIQNISKACYEVRNPGTIAKISEQFNAFRISKNSMVLYGANGVFFQRPLAAGLYSCEDKLFGDPVFGVVKACYIRNSEFTQINQAAQITQAKLTSQHGSFSLSKLTTVSYGANGAFFNKTLPSGTYSCNDKLFGDPVFGVIKSCYASDLSTPSMTMSEPFSQINYPDCQD